MLSTVWSHLRRQPLGFLALIVALGGTAYAAGLPRNSVGAKQIKANAVTSGKVKNGSLRAVDFKTGQLPAGAAGPAGPAGAAGPKGDTGAAGATGAAGSARAYGFINPTTCSGAPALCPVTHGKGITRVERISTGGYCIRVPGADAATDVLLTGVDYTFTNTPESAGSAMWASNNNSCTTATDFLVATQRIAQIDVRNAADNGPESVLDNNDDLSNTVAFTVMVP